MSRALSRDLRMRLVTAVEEGASCRSAAKRFGVASSTAIRWVSQWRSDGHIVPKQQGGDKRSRRIEVHAGEILALVDEMPNITLAELVDYLIDKHNLSVSVSTVWRFLDRHGMAKREKARENRSRRSPPAKRKRQRS